ncbi:G-protein alpha subunit-domain-containing protein [Cercophora scortea]|uniref:G-protein alpha subunit-domain-containing protein n=1 Tax=Cercophora scortea TaxID=314031 RepID=A0AAE0IWI7_9PEZI|nr:G-protein alpha subunit-domain-containing protein [Cercophora scortea]
MTTPISEFIQITASLQVLSHTVDTVTCLKKQLGDADLVASRLENGLMVMRAALVRVQRHANGITEIIHQQRMMIYLERCIPCCRLLIGKLDMEMSLFLAQDRHLNALDNLKLVFESKGMRRVLQMVENATNALNLISRAADGHALPLIESLRLRSLLAKLESGTASIAVSRDEGATISAYTEPPTSISLKLPLLFTSPRLIKRGPLTSIPNTLRVLKILGPNKDTLRSQEIDRQLMRDCLNQTRDVLLIGTGESSTSDILRALELANSRQRIDDEISPELLASYRSAILQSIVRTTHSILDAMSQFEMPPQTEAGQRAAEFLAAYQLSTTDNSSKTPGPDFVEAISSLLGECCVQSLMEDQEMLNISASSKYLLSEVRRICTPDYIPTEEDVLRCEAAGQDTGNRRLQSDPKALEYNIYSAGKQPPERAKKWIHYFDGLNPSVFFIVDLGLFDQVLAEDPTKNKFVEAIRTFKALADTHLKPRMTITCLLLCNPQAVRTRLSTSPLSDYFPEYTLGATGNNAAFDALKFLYNFSAIESGMDIVHIMDLANPKHIWAVYGAIKDYVFQQTCFGAMCGGRGGGFY